MSGFNAIIDMIIEDWIGVSVGIIGIAIAIYIYFSTRQRKILAYKHAGVRLLGLQDGGLPSDITVQFKGSNIPRLTRSLVVIWNAGELTISKDDLVRKDPLRLILPEDGDVLSVTVLKTSRDVIGFETHSNTNSPNEIEVTFDFLDSNDGAVIEVLHTSETRDAEVHGAVRGIPRGIRNLGAILGPHRRDRLSRRTKSFALFPKVIGVVAFVQGGIFVMLPLLIWTGVKAANPERGPIMIIAIFLAGVLMVLMGSLIVWQTRRRYPAALHVEELE